VKSNPLIHTLENVSVNSHLGSEWLQKVSPLIQGTNESPLINDDDVTTLDRIATYRIASHLQWKIRHDNLGWISPNFFWQAKSRWSPTIKTPNFKFKFGHFFAKFVPHLPNTVCQKRFSLCLRKKPCTFVDEDKKASL